MKRIIKEYSGVTSLSIYGLITWVYDMRHQEEGHKEQPLFSSLNWKRKITHARKNKIYHKGKVTLGTQYI